MATFAEALYSLPTARLRDLAFRRNVDPRRIELAADKRQLVQFLSSELGKPQAVVNAVLRCNARELRLLQLVLAVSSSTAFSWKSVLEAAGGQWLDESMTVVLAGLEDLGLAVRIGDAVHVVESVRHQVPTSLADHYTLRGCLQGYDAPTLRHIAHTVGVDAGNKTENVDAIARRLLSSGNEQSQRLRMGSEEQAVLDYIVQSGGAAAAIEVASAVLKSTDDFFRYDWQNRWKAGKERNAIDRLLAHGLVYVVSYAYGFNLFLVTPGDLLRAFTGESRAAFWTSPPPRPVVLVSPTTSTIRNGSLIRDTVALLAFISTQESVRTNTGYIHKTSLKNLSRNLSLQDDRYAAFLYAICRTSGMIAPSTDKLAYSVTPKGGEWLDSAPIDQVQTLYNAWSMGDFWGEMYDDPLKRANEYRNLESVVSVRNAALDLVAANSQDDFVEIDSLTNVMSYRYPLLLAQTTRLGGDLVASPASFIRLVIGECLYWLGLIELARFAAEPYGDGARQKSAPDPSRVPHRKVGPSVEDVAAVAFRLTPDGALMLGLPDPHEPDQPPAEIEFILQANAEIFLPPYLRPGTLYRLLLISEPTGKAPSGNMVSITRESIRRALDRNVSGNEILTFLRSHARTGIPQNVEYLINEVSQKHGHIHIGRAQMYVQVDSPIVLKEIQARRELKPYFVRTLGDTVAILNASEPDKLLKELRKAGYFPISDDAPKSTGFRFSAAVTPREKSIPRSSPEPPSAEPKVQSTANWDRFARDDGRSWSESNRVSAPLSRPSGAVQDKENIRSLLLDAVRGTTRVQIATKGPRDAAPVVRVIEPLRVMGNFVSAYLPLEDERDTLNIEHISWACATDDVFAPP